MKKQSLKTQGLSLNKKVVAQFDKENISGGSGGAQFASANLSCGNEAGPRCNVTRLCTALDCW